MRKVSAFFVLASVFIGLSFISCDNFLTGSAVRDQLEKQIDYANAPSYKITIEYPKKSGVVKIAKWRRSSEKGN